MRNVPQKDRPIAPVARPLDGEPRALISEDVMSERYGDEVILLHLKTNRFFALNKTGSRLWELLSRGECLSAIQEKLCGEFDVDPMELRADVERMLASLRDEQLVQFQKA